MIPVDTIYATKGLLEYLREYAEDRDPVEVTVSLAVTPAGELDIPDLDPEIPVFTDFYMPQAGASVNFVFGVDLGTPAGQTQGRFVSHPTGELRVSKTDDLHEAIFVAVPPYDESSLAVFDRSGNRKKLEVLDVEPAEVDHGL